MQGREPAIEVVSICIGGPPLNIQNPAEVGHLRMCRASFLEGAKPVALRDAKTKALHGYIDTEALLSSLGPGDTLPGYLQSSAPTLVARGVSLCRLQEFRLGMLCPFDPCVRRGTEVGFPINLLLRLQQGRHSVWRDSFGLTCTKPESGPEGASETKRDSNMIRAGDDGRPMKGAGHRRRQEEPV